MTKYVEIKKTLDKSLIEEGLDFERQFEKVKLATIQKLEAIGFEDIPEMQELIQNPIV